MGIVCAADWSVRASKKVQFKNIPESTGNKPIFGFSISGERGASNTDKSRNTGPRDTQRMEKGGHSG